MKQSELHFNEKKSLSYCKAVVLDFDRTLCAKNYIRAGGDIYELYLNELTRQAEMHELDKPLPCMQKLVEQVRNNGKKIVCLSQTQTNLRDDYNKNFLSRYYGNDIAYITVSKPEQKIDMMVAYCVANSIPVEQCAIVDDNMGTLEQAASFGFKCFHVSDVALWYELNEKAATDFLCDNL